MKLGSGEMKRDSGWQGGLQESVGALFVTLLFMYWIIWVTGPKEGSSMPKSNPPEALGFTCQATSSQGMMAAAPALSPAENMADRNCGRGYGYATCGA